MLLATTCNQGLPDTALIAIDHTRREEVSFLRVANEGRGLTGICFSEDRVFLAEQFPSNRLHILDRSLRLLATHRLAESVDVHSILFDRSNEVLYWVNTGRDRVERASFDPTANRLGPPAIVWGGGGLRADTLHFNGLTAADGHLLVSGFGLPASSAHEKDVSATGFILDVTTGEFVERGLDHPHSVACDDEGTLYWLESRRGRLAIRRKGHDVRHLAFSEPGYLRGLVVAPDSIVVATSENRRVSKSTGRYRDFAERGRCSLVSIDRETDCVTGRIDLTGFASEIYEVVRLPDRFDTGRFVARGLAERARDLNERVLQLDANGSTARSLPSSRRLVRSLDNRFGAVLSATARASGAVQNLAKARRASIGSETIDRAEKEPKNPNFAAYDDDFLMDVQAHSDASAPPIVEFLVEALEVSTVVDVGCGPGSWLRQFEQRGCRSVGIDGPHVTPYFEGDRRNLLVADLATSLPVKGRFDLAICLEVAEHLPPDRTETLVADLVALAPAVLFSAAIPRQPGVGHVNMRWQSDWRGLFEQFGYLAHDAIRAEFWTDPQIAWWYKQNVVLYTKDVYPHLHPCRTSQPFDIVHPDLWLQAPGQSAGIRQSLRDLRSALGRRYLG